ncbi:Fc.00g036850.m01.CDS01 [Cosmosporella sp. VM-42]
MRPPRIAILALFLTATLFIFCRFAFSSARSASTAYPTTSTSTKSKSDRSVWGLMYYNTPFSLFPPNAAISLTDDNSTSFAARPAAFGPKLVTKGLSGQLWVGSGFAEDSLDGNGELGCSDLPGWDSGNGRTNLKNALKAAAPRVATPKEEDTEHPKRGEQLLDRDNRDNAAGSRLRLRAANDGTDNYLHQGLNHAMARHENSGSSSHADIQSIQEAAEIQGKVVLLMRGGCGFLEKVMWAQRRGAIAVIVGDNQKGGPLIQMFAHGDDVDNVTIPSVFTARTTAHLLSSLTQPGSFVEDSLDDNGNPVLKVQQNSRVNKNRKSESGTPASPKTTVASTKEKRSNKDNVSKAASSGWFSSLFSWGGSSPAVEDKSRPPSSGRLDWVLVEDFDDEKDKMIRDSMEKKPKKPKVNKSTEDDFVIGVQDWRDPDLRDSKSKKSKSRDKTQEPKPESKEGFKSSSTTFAEANGPKGGSITPGSGEYIPTKSTAKSGSDALSRPRSSISDADGGKGFLAKLFGKDEDSQDDIEVLKGADAFTLDEPQMPDMPDSDAHEGLWVTITPTSSASPFFDTLLVLVISPLVTLTVVYALLILRARIRRRRWRAPKSVVERLPVRTYHTVAASPSLSPRLPSPTSSSPTTPLLQQQNSSQPQTRPRPRSRTTTGIPEDENLLTPSSALPTPRTASRNRPREHEKGSGGFSAEWKKYMGRQVECVVCLEEYVDGVSKVMSLPCGHEFHVECITPWLTTRRRTCPICKGDVVRSLRRGGSSSPRYEPYHDDSDDDEEPDAEGSGSRSADRDSDLEQGLLSSEPGPSRGWTRHEGWLSLFSTGFNGGRPQSPSRSRSRSPEDRSR